MQSTAKVGALLVVFVALLIGGYAILGANLFAPKTDGYVVDFADAGGISAGTRVLMAGVKIGTVTQIRLVSPTRAEAFIQISPRIKIPLGSQVMLPGSLIGLGETALEIKPPPGPWAGDFQVGAHLMGSKEGPLDQILPGGGRETVAELNKTLADFRKLLENTKFQSQASTLLASTNHTMENASRLTQNADGLILRMNGFFDQNQAKLRSALESGTKAVADVHRVTAAFAEYAATGKLQKGTTEILASLTSAAKRADALVMTMTDLVNDPKLREPITETLANTADITKTGKKIATNSEEITQNGVEISKNGILMSQKAEEIEDKASGIEDQLKGVLDKVGGFFGKTPGKASLPPIGYDLDLLRTNNPNHWRTDVNFTVPLTQESLTFGVYDAFESSKYNAQIIKPINPALDYRYGIYASKAGVGVDSLFDRKFSLRGDLWNINNPQFDLKLGYQFGNGLTGFIGIDRLFNGNSAVIGIGVRK